MPVQFNLKATGLSTFSNNLDLNPGALLIADNVVIDRPNVIEQRRGFAAYGDPLPNGSDRAKQLLTYKGSLLRHYDTSLQYDSDNAGTFLQFDGSYGETEAGLRIKSIESNGNLYFTTSEGVKKISVTGANQFTTAANFITQAGAPKALDLELDLSTTANGFLPYQSKAAYRVVWGSRDANSNLILGFPSQRSEIAYGLLDSIIPEFNNVLLNLDDSAASAATVALHTSSNYFEELALNPSFSLPEVLANFVLLTEKLDSDFTFTKALTITNAQITTATDLYLTFSTAPSVVMSVGDKVALSGISLPTANNTTAAPFWTVSDLGPTTARFAITGGAVSSVVSSGTAASYNYRAIEVPTLGAIPTYSDYQEVYDYFGNIISELNSEPAKLIQTGFPSFNIPNANAEVKVKFSIPPEINTSNFNSYFYQVYRTETITSQANDIDLPESAGDEMYLVFEDNPTSAQVTAGEIEVIDTVPDELLGVFLYTNENSGEGILQANDRLPLAKDVALFKDCVFYANTVTNHQRTLTLLGVDNLIRRLNLTVVSTEADAGVATIVFSSDVSSQIAIDDVLYLSSFVDNSSYLNGAFKVLSVATTTITLEIINLGTFSLNTDSADFGTIDFCEQLKIVRGVDQKTLYFVPVKKEQVLVTTVAASSLASSGTASYWLISSPDTDYYVWYKNGTSTDPAISGKTGIEVILTGSETADQVAEKTQLALYALVDFNDDVTSVNGDDFIITCAKPGFTNNASAGTSGFTVIISEEGTGESASDDFVGLYQEGTPSQNIEDTSKSLIKVLNKNTVINVYGYYTSTPTGLSGQMLFQANDLSVDAFYFNTSSVTAGEAFDPTVPVTGNSIISDNISQPNGLYYSKSRQPESVPSVNLFTVGPRDRKILRILALRDSLFVLKEDGIYRVSGDGPNNFSVFLFDTSARILAADSAVVLNNQIYMWSDQGVVRVSDTGVDIISRGIEDKLNRLVYTQNFRTATFGVSYDLDRAYLLWLPENVSDTVAKQCYRLNILTNSWTRWPISKTCGVVNLDNKLYLGSGDDNYIERERKLLDRTDFCDRELPVQLSINSVSDTLVRLPSLVNIKVHDVLAQTQYVTILQFNNLLKKIDLDPSTSLSNDYFSTLGITDGANIEESIKALAAKLDVDLGTTIASNPTVVAATNVTPITLQAAFNAITTIMNGSQSVVFNNYPTLSGTVFYEALITQVDTKQVAVVLNNPLPFVVGELMLFKHYKSKVQYAPQHFGNPVVLKQVREATYLFFSDNFTGATFSYSSDLSPGFDTLDIVNTENGTFGNHTFGESYFGGTGQSIPIRVLIPQQKQRCTFLRCQFEHNNAREMYQLYGLSLTVEVNAVDARAYR